MEYINHVYKSLIQQYPSWPELKTYLTSAEGGSLHISDSKGQFCIIRNKATNPNVEHTKWFRSTVWDTIANRPVSVSPPKTCKEFPYKSCEEVMNAGLYCQEFLDGFMINCFKYKGLDEVFITSRSKLDATGHFYSSKTFRELFLDAYSVDRVPLQDALESPDFDRNELAISYSFLVKHKEHRVVSTITENRVFLVQKSVIMEDGSVHISDATDIPVLQMDASLDFDTWFKQQCTSWEFQGVTLKDSNGNRWRFRNEDYMAVKSLRGNSATQLERFVQLYLRNASQAYLYYFPEDSFTFICNNVFMNMIHQIVYDYYCRIHITKVCTMNEVEPQYRRHIYSLHRHYVDVLRPLKEKIRHKDVVTYFAWIPWQVIAHLLRLMQDSYFSQMSEIVSQ